ncbi:hypothetical protein GTA62_18555 [Roseobacter sp. HKCCD9010]|uniref:hypothetical protein n=1 Tax=unclassified Roseobacter TaxID=196798 RepID=UPI0014915471|nr:MULTISPECIES: hypothetical protein [unclassified Roseobacter]MBF9051921.1 hypothetical protein [Rhodobacterales bacterium HKCCD4356]NNV13914.1 hypothetical protein [Roseobacter sp. HKCCD7357]NNV18086.1 hypothetical protein [Roseobacter sp. HKCCD8768]NNV27546.1 hypothetical protein [Roseobacter sp. HKCCD8192]NNV31812.1 hypothetical protein [Roseobacter sp. HKCCD9061]
MVGGFTDIVMICAALVTGMLMICIAWDDATRFEIDPALMLWINALAFFVIWGVEDPHGAVISLAVGALVGVTAMVVRLVRPSGISLGDIGLFALLGVIGGPLFTPLLLALFVFFGALISVSYSVARGKRAFRSTYPAAVPAMAAAIPVFIGRVGVGLWPESRFAMMSKFNIIYILGHF